MSTMDGPAGRLEPISTATEDDVVRLNAEHVELLAPMDHDRLRMLRSWTHHASVIRCDGQVAGFVLTVAPGTAYDSENYRWFGDRYGDAFLYLDRIVIDDGFRRRGLATAVYDTLEEQARDRGRMVLEVNLELPNEGSLAFHRARGYLEVGTRGEPGHRVVLMAKELGPNA